MTGDGPPGFRVGMLYHPSLLVPDLDRAEDFFARVFGRPSTRLSTLSDAEPPDGWSNDYATFTPIADLLLDSIDPRRYVAAGRHPYPAVDRPQLKGLGWYVDGIDELYRALVDHGYAVLDQFGEPVVGDRPPTAAGSRMPLFFTSEAETGIRHELLPRFPFPLDHRQAPGWSLGPPPPDDPLGIVRCLHHGVATAAPDRALGLLVDVLGGEVTRVAHDDLWDAQVTHVRLADTEIALIHVGDGAAVSEGGGSDGTPDGGAPGGDEYRSIAFEVADLARAEAHLEACGVAIAARADEAILTEPATSLGIAWRFTRSGAAAPVDREPMP